MPSTGIHLLVAYSIKPEAHDLYWVGNFAPDYTKDRELKNKIHLRDTTDRWDSLKKLYLSIDKNNDFEIGWFLHLFVDTCWDEKELIEYKNWFQSINENDNWYQSYSEEIRIVSRFLYHNLPWSNNIWQLIKNAKISNINTFLPISISEIEYYRDWVVKRHSESTQNQNPIFFTFEKIKDFSNNTVNKYKKWLETF